MQKVFTNGNCHLFNETLDVAQALFTNDESVVLTGSNEEVLQMKTPETLEVELKGKTVIPALYDVNSCVFNRIEKCLIDEGKEKFIENEADIDENYEHFANFKHYHKIFLKIQDEYIKNGILTIFELQITAKSFTFWKKIAESGELKIDVIGYVDIKSSKDVMDNNCRSYRKYKNCFRLAGYSVELDGEITQARAWLKKPYKGSKTSVGYPKTNEEQLSFIIKTAIEEKRQLFVIAHGDAAIEQFLRVSKAVFAEKKDDDKFRPALFGADMLTKKEIKEIKELGISVCFEFSNVYQNSEQIKEVLGRGRFNKMLPLSLLLKSGVVTNVYYNDKNFLSPFKQIQFVSTRVTKEGKKYHKKFKLESFEILKMMLKNGAFLAFETEHKSSLENGKKANFLILNNPLTVDEYSTISVEDVYKDNEKIYPIKKKKKNSK
ncbi:MAG: amidohydrolase family protein [Clostridia bacterium]|nr:amidohydrolase family protein [Clostridia bacterium]